MCPTAEATLIQLMQASLAGDTASYQRFLSLIAPFVHSIVTAKASGISREDKEDIVQDVLLAIHQKRHTWRQDKALKPWLYAITRYKIVDCFRKRGKHIHVDIEDYAESLSDTTNSDIPMASSHDLQSLVDKLSGKQALAVRAIGLEGLSITQAAKKLGMKEGTVRVNFHRGLQKLRQRSAMETS